MLPDLFRNLFTSNAIIHNHFTRQQNQYHAHGHKSIQMERSIKINGAKVANLFNKLIDYKCSITTYKKHLKSLLLDEGNLISLH